MKNGAQIQYWSGMIYTDRSLKDVLKPFHKEALAKCFYDTKSAGFHKLNGYDNIYAIGYNNNGHNEGRLILTIKDGKLIVLADLPNHNYRPKLKSLRKILNFFNNNEVALDSDSSSDDDDDSTEDPEKDFEKMDEAPVYDIHSANNNNNVDDDNPEIDYQPVVFECSSSKPNVLVLDEDQVNVIEIAMPAIVSGPPGSGKTTVARALLSQVGQLREGEKIVYLARSKNLVGLIKKELNSIATDEMKTKIEVKTYNDFISNEDVNNNNAKRVENPKEATIYIKNWLQKYCKNNKHKNALSDDFKNDEDNLIQEFRIRSGFDEETYRNTNRVGEKQSLYKSKKHREWVNDAYKAFIADLAKMDFLIADYTEIPTGPKFHTVIVDEAQDLSNLQLASIKNKLAESNRLCFFYGDGQSLEDDVPSKIYIEGMFAAPLSVKKVSLTQHYRCPEEVMSVARVVDSLRRKHTKNKKEEPIIVRTDANRIKGAVKWATKDPQELEALRNLIATAKADVCIVTHSDLKEDAQKLFGAQKWQVLTPEDVKGFQYHTVIIYDPLYDKKFKEIDKASVEEKIEDASFSSPLSQLFVSITRAEKEVIFYAKTNRKNLQERLIKAIDATQSQVQMNAPKSSDEDLEKRAVSLMRNDDYESGQAILKGELKYTEAKIATFLKKHAINLPEDNANAAHVPNSKITVKTQSKKTYNSDELIRDIKKGSTQKLEEAIHQKVDLKAKIAKGPYQGCTLLFIAAISNNTDAVMLLINTGLPVETEQNHNKYEGQTALYAASNAGCTDVVKALAPLADVNQIQGHGNSKGMSALCVAASQNHLECVKALVGSRAKVNQRQGDGPSKGMTALYAACTAGNTDVAKYLIDNHADVNLYSMHGTNVGVSSFMVACELGRTDIVKHMLSKGNIKINQLQEAGTNRGSSGLLRAAHNGHIETVAALIEAGADIDQMGECEMKGVSALGIAMFNCKKHADNMKIARLLLEKGASLYTLAEENNYTKEAKKVCQRIAECEQEAMDMIGKELNVPGLFQSIYTDFMLDKARKNPQLAELHKLFFKVRWGLYNKQNKSELLEQILTELIVISNNYTQNHPDFVKPTSELNGCTPLFIAASKNDVQAINEIVAENIDVDEKQEQGNYLGYSALEIAVSKGHLAAVEALLRAGACINMHKLTNPNMLSTLSRFETCGIKAILIIKAELSKHLAAIQDDRDTDRDIFPLQAFIKTLMKELDTEKRYIPLLRLIGEVRWLIYRDEETNLTTRMNKALQHLFIDYLNRASGVLIKEIIASSESFKSKVSYSSALARVRQRVLTALSSNTIGARDARIIATVGIDAILNGNDELKNGSTTPLYDAACWDDINQVNMLIAKGADVNHVENQGIHQGFTPLYAAACSGYQSESFTIVKALLKAGADTSLLPGRTIVDDKIRYESQMYNEQLISLFESSDQEVARISKLISEVVTQCLPYSKWNSIHSSVLRSVVDKIRGSLDSYTNQNAKLLIEQYLIAALEKNELFTHEGAKEILLHLNGPALLNSFKQVATSTSTGATSTTSTNSTNSGVATVTKLAR